MNSFQRVNVIKHLPTSTLYGIYKNKKIPFILCFDNVSDAKHIMYSITTHKDIHKKNPHQNLLCMHSHIDFTKYNDIKSFEYGLCLHELYLQDLFNNLYNRNIGIFFIHEIFKKDSILDLRSIQLYPNDVSENSRLIIENDYYL